MEILGIGPLELFFIVIIALIVLGPKDMVKAGKTIGSFLRKLVTSSGWRTIQQTSRELKHLPNKLMTEAGLDEIEKDLSLKDIEKDLGLKEIEKEMGLNEINKDLDDMQKDINKELSDWITPPTILNDKDTTPNGSPNQNPVAENLPTSTETITDNPPSSPSLSNT